jgi:carboxyl-terminal processing protease
MRGTSSTVGRTILLGSSVAWGALALILALSVHPAARSVGAADAKLTTPRVDDRLVTRAVNKLIKDAHLSKHALDDEISERGLHLFIKMLDNRKLYFTKDDVAEFEKSKDQLDDQVAAGDVTFAYTVFQKLLTRIDERVVQIDALLKEDFDFTQDEVLVTNWDKQEFPKDAAEAKDRWRKLLKYDLLVLKTDKDEKAKKDEPKARLSRRYHSFAKRMHQTDADELLEMYLTSITSSYDPHTTYMSPSSLENFRIMMSLNLDGIGAQLKVDDGYAVIDKIVAGGAAEKNGQLKEQDRVVQVGQGEDGEMVDVVDMKLNDVVKLIRGRAGSIVRLGVLPAVGGEIKTIKITRAKIELKDSEARGKIVEEGKKGDGTPYKVGYIDLPSFYLDMEAKSQGRADYKSTTRDVRKILEDFKAKGVDALILDLRKNGGGSLTESIDLTGLFIETGPVVQVKNPDGSVLHYDDMDPDVAWEGPMVVLTTKFSASASEILAGAIQDYGRGLIVGDSSTHGKGTVQQLVDVGPVIFKVRNPQNLGALKLTMQQFYRPNGDSTQKRGVLADVVLPSISDHMDVSEADLDYSLNFDKVPSAKFTRQDKVPGTLIAELKTLTQSRQVKSEDFAKQGKNIERYEEFKKKKEYPLSEAKFLAKKAELDSEKEEEKAIAEDEDKKEVFKRTFYENEAINITLDYVRLLNKEKVARAK